jgi:hypothetical protein
MNWGVTGLLIVFAAFIVLLVFSPSLSCFGRRLKSPFYPLTRRRKIAPPAARSGKPIRTDDYGFKLSDQAAASAPKPGSVPQPKSGAAQKAEDYGFKP